MVETVGRALEARRRGQQQELATRGVGRGGGIAFERGLHHVFDPLDVVELEVHGAAARGIQSFAAVLVAKPQQLLPLAQLGPGEVSGQQLLEEAANVDSLALPLADQGVGITAGIGREFFGVIAVVG